MKKAFSLIAVLFTGLAGCSVTTKEADSFLTAVSLKDGVYNWLPGTGNSVEGWAVQSIAVQNGGQTIVVYTTQTPPVRYILTYDSPISSDRAYYRNTVAYTPDGAAAPLRVVRYAGIRVYNGRLVWAGYTSSPMEADWQGVSTQADFDAFNKKFWGKDKITFTREYAVLGL